MEHAQARQHAPVWDPPPTHGGRKPNKWLVPGAATPQVPAHGLLMPAPHAKLGKARFNAGHRAPPTARPGDPPRRAEQGGRAAPIRPRPAPETPEDPATRRTSATKGHAQPKNNGGWPRDTEPKLSPAPPEPWGGRRKMIIIRDTRKSNKHSLWPTQAPELPDT